MKATLKGKYEYDTDKAGATSAISTISIPLGTDLKLRASISDATFVKGPSFNGLSFALDKPGSFLFDFNVPKQDFRFQFTNSVRVAEKPLNLTYFHHSGQNRTILEGTLALDPANKVSASHVLGSKNGKFKYSYVHNGFTTFEPCYDLSKNSWDFALSRRVYADDVLKASYQTSNQLLGLEWTRNSKFSGCFKFSAFFNLAEEKKVPRLMAESTWNFEM